MGEAFHSGSACLSGNPLGRLDMYGMKRVLSRLDVKADRIHDGKGAGDGRRDRAVVIDIGANRFNLGIAGKPCSPPIGMARGDGQESAEFATSVAT